MCRVRKDITISKKVIEQADKLCIDLDMKRSTYIEMLIRADLKKRNILVENKKKSKTWDGNIEDMPLDPKNMT